MFLSSTNFENYIKWKRKRVSNMQDNIVICNKSFTSSENPSHMVLGMKFQNHADEYIFSNYHRVRQQRVYGLSTRLPYRYLMDYTVSLHSIAQMGCATGQSMAFKNGGNFPQSYVPECIATVGSPNVFSHQLFTKCNASQLEAMCHIPQTVPQPPGYDCVAV